MADSRAARLAPVVDMAENAERTAAQRLEYFHGQVRVAQSKLGDLERFRGDYQEQWVERGKLGVSAIIHGLAVIADRPRAAVARGQERAVAEFQLVEGHGVLLFCTL